MLLQTELSPAFQRRDAQADRLKTVSLKLFHSQKYIIPLLHANDSKLFHSLLRVRHSNAPSLLPYVQLSLRSNDIVVILVVKVLEGQYQKRSSVWKNILCVLGTAHNW